MKLRLFTLLLFVVCLPGYAAELMSKHEFARQYIKYATEKYPGIKMKLVDEGEIAVTLPDKKEITAYLDNAYTDYRNAPENLSSILENYVGTILLSNNLADEKFTKQNIFPVIKDELYIRQIQQITKERAKKGKAGAGFVYEKLNEVLYVVYAFDTPKAIRFIHGDDLKEVGVKRSELRDIALHNLKTTFPKLKLEGDPAHVSALVADGTYEASFLLLDDIWTKEQFPVKGELVVYVPTRDFVMITGSKDKEGLRRVLEIMNNPENQWSHAITDTGFVRRKGKWVVFHPDKSLLGELSKPKL
ncbi:MAG: DUF1444 family protein [Gammaproteobacteria bacterium]|nr:DUF1444 family protein [Gammaproteobacteria bacterium]MDH5653562.1 DUF1444 family protein [Gammaproteobacteria bacterium]